MATTYRSIIGAILITFQSHAAYGNPPTGWKAHALPPDEEKRWIETVKTHKTLDGATVMQVLKHAEQMRPKRFKLAAIEVGYNGATGEPESVMISYFIGMKRLHGDDYSIGYEIKRNGKEIQLSLAKRTDDTPFHALEAGRDSFLLMIDDLYRDTCIERRTNAKLC